MSDHVEWIWWRRIHVTWCEWIRVIDDGQWAKGRWIPPSPMRRRAQGGRHAWAGACPHLHAQVIERAALRREWAYLSLSLPHCFSIQAPLHLLAPPPRLGFNGRVGHVESQG